ncbi:hypothetical protein ES708_26392 [subsurface metagenome]
MVVATPWTNGTNISYNIPDGLLEGDHNITIFVSDESGNMSQNTVIFTVNNSVIPGIPLVNLLILISVSVFILKRKINHRKIRK